MVNPYIAWSRYAQIDLTIATTISNQPVRLVIPYSNGMSDDYSDLRFTTLTVDALSYWIEEYTTDVQAVVWVKIPTTGTSQIYCFYDKSDATSASSGEDVFTFFDDFAGTTLDTEKWSVIQGTVTVDDALILTSTSSTRGLIESIQTFDNTHILETKVKADSTTQDATHFCAFRQAGTWNNRLFDLYTSTTTGRYSFSTAQSGTLVKNDPVGTYVANVYYLLKCYYLDGVSYGYQDNTLVSSSNSYIYTGNCVIAFYEGLTASAGTTTIDWVRTRTYLSSEPELDVFTILSFYPGDFGSSSTITLSAATSIEDQVIKVEVPYQTGMQYDFADLRFTDSDGIPFAFWIEEVVNGECAIVWVKIPDTSTESITCYWNSLYGSVETTSSGEDTFIFFDDFDTETSNWNITITDGTVPSGSTATTDSSFNFNSICDIKLSAIGNGCYLDCGPQIKFDSSGYILVYDSDDNETNSGVEWTSQSTRIKLIQNGTTSIIVVNDATLLNDAGNTLSIPNNIVINGLAELEFVTISTYPTTDVTTTFAISAFPYDAWNRKATITLTPATSLSGQIIDITIPYYSGMQRDFGDIRFYSNEGYALLYLIDDVILGSTCTFKIAIPKVGTESIFCYWYNSNAESESTTNIFELYINFRDYSSVPSFMQSAGAAISVQMKNEGLYVDGDGSSTSGVVYDNRNLFGVNTALEFRALFREADSGTYWSGEIGFLNSINTSSANPNVFIAMGSQGTIENYFVITTDNGVLHTRNFTNVLLNSVFHKFRIERTSDSVSFYYDDTLLYTLTADIPTDDMYIGSWLQSSAGFQIIDWMRVYSIPTTESVATLDLSIIEISENPYPEWLNSTVINLSTRTTIFDQIIEFDVPYYPEMNSDFSDIRFTTVGGTVLNYWIESYTDSDTAHVFVKLPSLGTRSIVIFYNNFDAETTSNGYDVFPFFEDFTDEFGIHKENWNYRTGNYLIDNKILEIGNGPSYIVTPTPYNLYTHILRGQMAFATGTTDYPHGIFMSSSKNLTTGVYVAGIGNAGHGYTDKFSLYNYHWGYDYATSIPDITSNPEEFYAFKLKKQTSTGTTELWIKQLTESAYTHVSNSALTSSVTDTYIAIYGYTSTLYVKFLYLMPFVEIEPTVTFGAETLFQELRFTAPIILDSTTSVDNELIRMTIPFYPTMETDFSDIRIVDDDSNSLSFWIESVTERESMDVWIRVPNSSTSELICFWGGVPGIETISAGTDTFDLFDTFDYAYSPYEHVWSPSGSISFPYSSTISGSVTTIDQFEKDSLLRTRIMGSGSVGWSDINYSISGGDTDWHTLEFKVSGSTSIISVDDIPVTSGSFSPAIASGSISIENNICDWAFIDSGYFGNSAELDFPLDYTDWLYSETVTLSAATTAEDHLVLVTVVMKEDEMNYDFSDIRFSDISGTPLRYAHEPSVWVSSMRFWVEVHDIGTTEIIVYWGNASAIDEDAKDRLFIFYEFFDDLDIIDIKWATLNCDYHIDLQSNHIYAEMIDGELIATRDITLPDDVILQSSIGWGLVDSGVRMDAILAHSMYRVRCALNGTSTTDGQALFNYETEVRMANDTSIPAMSLNSWYPLLCRNSDYEQEYSFNDNLISANFARTSEYTSALEFRSVLSGTHFRVKDIIIRPYFYPEISAELSEGVSTVNYTFPIMSGSIVQVSGSIAGEYDCDVFDSRIGGDPRNRPTPSGSALPALAGSYVDLIDDEFGTYPMWPISSRVGGSARNRMGGILGNTPTTSKSFDDLSSQEIVANDGKTYMYIDSYLDGFRLPIIAFVTKINGDLFANADVILKGLSYNVLTKTDHRGIFYDWFPFDQYDNAVFISKSKMLYEQISKEEISTNTYEYVLGKLTKSIAPFRMMHRYMG